MSHAAKKKCCCAGGCWRRGELCDCDYGDENPPQSVWFSCIELDNNNAGVGDIVQSGIWCYVLTSDTSSSQPQPPEVITFVGDVHENCNDCCGAPPSGSLPCPNLGTALDQCPSAFSFSASGFAGSNSSVGQSPTSISGVLELDQNLSPARWVAGGTFSQGGSCQSDGDMCGGISRCSPMCCRGSSFSRCTLGCSNFFHNGAIQRRWTVGVSVGCSDCVTGGSGCHIAATYMRPQSPNSPCPPTGTYVLFSEPFFNTFCGDMTGFPAVVIIS